MIDKERRKEILKRARPSSLLAGEVHLGSWYTEEEIEAVTRAIRDSMDWNKGFTGEEIEEFERNFAKYIGTEYAIAINGAGAGLDAEYSGKETCYCSSHHASAGYDTSCQSTDEPTYQVSNSRI